MTEQNRGVNPNIYSSQRENLSPREALIERWKNAPMKVYRYSAGKVTNPQGNTYEYLEGARLGIGDQLEVMDSCQRPWTNATVHNAFSALDLNHSRYSQPETKYDVQVLERGFGMGMIASKIMDYLTIRRGSYTCIELNGQIARYADKTWRNKQDQRARHWATSIRGGTARDAKYLPMTVIRGDAFEETAKLAEEEKKFDIIISDTYPLSEEEKSVNDLLDLETLVNCLNPDGVFAFFGYHSGSQGGMNERQRNLVEKYFDEVSRTIVKGINPPSDYKYFNPESGPIRELPVIICTKPRIQAVA